MKQAWVFVHFGITFFPNRVRITDPRTGVTIDRTSELPFSSEYRLLEDRERAAVFVGDVVREMARRGSRGRSRITWPTADVAIVEGPSTHNDRREVEELLTHVGCYRANVS
jgi:hypothetical protein